jgi:hypothetical protein
MRRLTQLKVPCVDPARMAQRRFLRSELCWGYRIYFHNARWQLQPPPSKYAPVNRSVPNPQRRTNLLTTRRSLILKKWSKRTMWNIHTDIILPEEAQRVDLLLIPQTPASTNSENAAIPALVARKIGDSQLQLVGKALFAARQASRLKSGQPMASQCRAYLAHDDAIVMAHSCGWMEWSVLHCQFNRPIYHGVDKYFETRLCVEGTLSYGTQMGFKPPNCFLITR